MAEHEHVAIVHEDSTVVAFFGYRPPTGRYVLDMRWDRTIPGYQTKITPWADMPMIATAEDIEPQQGNASIVSHSPGKVWLSHTTTKEQCMTLDEVMLAIIDVLIEDDGFFTADHGRVLTGMASRVFGEDIPVGDRRYGATSIAVLRLEQVGFVEVERQNRDEAQKANILLSIRLR